jgi:hypothetical protein
MSVESTFQSFLVSAEVGSFMNKLTGQASISVLLTAAYGFFTAKVSLSFLSLALTLLSTN